jgi:hypothetical protein
MRLTLNGWSNFQWFGFLAFNMKMVGMVDTEKRRREYRLILEGSKY